MKRVCIKNGNVCDFGSLPPSTEEDVTKDSRAIVLADFTRRWGTFADSWLLPHLSKENPAKITMSPAFDVWMASTHSEIDRTQLHASNVLGVK